MKEERAWLLLSLQLSGEATAEEVEELEMILQQYPELGLRVETVTNLWNQKRPAGGSDKTRSFNKHLQRLSNHLSVPALQYEQTETGESTAIEMVQRPVVRMRKWLWLTAGAAACVLIFILLFSLESANKNTAAPVAAGNTVSTRPGSKSKIELPDGTEVWLNADSKITCDPNFPGNIREVYLTGEAYFDVVKDPSRPFIIHTRSLDIKVLGTSFNVRSYPGEKATETALIHGTIEVTLHNNPDKKIILKPNEKLVVQNEMVMSDKTDSVASHSIAEPLLTLGNIRFNKSDTSSSIETMWVENKLAFENETLERIATEIERWYNVSFVIKNERLRQLHFTGIFKNKSLEDVMEALQFAVNFQFNIDNGTVTVW